VHNSNEESSANESSMASPKDLNDLIMDGNNSMDYTTTTQLGTQKEVNQDNHIANERFSEERAKLGNSSQSISTLQTSNDTSSKVSTPRMCTPKLSYKYREEKHDMDNNKSNGESGPDVPVQPPPIVDKISKFERHGKKAWIKEFQENQKENR
jgi:hypothetical protein